MIFDESFDLLQAATRVLRLAGCVISFSIGWQLWCNFEVIARSLLNEWSQILLIMIMMIIYATKTNKQATRMNKKISVISFSPLWQNIKIIASYSLAKGLLLVGWCGFGPSVYSPLLHLQYTTIHTLIWLCRIFLIYLFQTEETHTHTRHQLETLITIVRVYLIRQRQWWCFEGDVAVWILVSAMNRVVLTSN